jgi:hypothetical protein
MPRLFQLQPLSFLPGLADTSFVTTLAFFYVLVMLEFIPLSSLRINTSTVTHSVYFLSSSTPVAALDPLFRFDPFAQKQFFRHPNSDIPSTYIAECFLE